MENPASDAVRRALRGTDALVTGQPAIQRDLDPILALAIKKLIATKCGGEKAPDGFRQRLMVKIRTTIIEY